jgi:putative resolvase
VILSDYAKKLGIQYRTAWNHFKAGKIAGAYKLESGTIIVPDENIENLSVAIYTRVSSSENKVNLESQLTRVRKWATLNGFTVSYEVSEVGSGLNDNRKKLLKLLNNKNVGFIIVEHKDRLTRFGFNYIDALLKSRGGQVIVINQVDNDKEDLIQDFVSVITSFCARIYGHRRSKRKTEKVLENLEKDD